MDFDLSDEERDLADGVRTFCRGRFRLEVVRGLEDHGGVDRALWQELGEAGVFSLRRAEQEGGAGLGMVAAVLVFEQLGASLVPGPLVASHLAAALVAGAAEGRRVVGLVEAPADGARDGVQPVLIEHLEALDSLLLLDADGVACLGTGELAALGATRVEHPLDPLTPVHRVSGLPPGEGLGGPETAARLGLEGAALTSALALGVAQGALDLGVEYAKHRRQFDRPIAAFQAVKHMLADMLVRAELARAAVYAAGVTLDDPAAGDPARAVRVAKLQACEAAASNAKACVQVHGGMGFAWEVDAHLYLKRALVLSTVFGSPDANAEAMAGFLRA